MVKEKNFFNLHYNHIGLGGGGITNKITQKYLRKNDLTHFFQRRTMTMKDDVNEEEEGGSKICKKEKKSGCFSYKKNELTVTWCTNWLILVANCYQKKKKLERVFRFKLSYAVH